jgi:hypothetical protein
VFKFPHAVSQSFLSVLPYLSVGTMAKGQKCCHLPGEICHLAAKAGDRAQIYIICMFPDISLIGLFYLVHTSNVSDEGGKPHGQVNFA